MLNTRDNRDRIDRELRESQGHISIVEDQELLGRYFRKPGDQPVQTHICFNRRDDSPTIYVLVDHDLEYTGGDPEVRGAFAENSMRGWRQLFVPNDGDIEEALKTTESLLGLSGRPPSLHLQNDQPRLAEQIRAEMQDDEEEREFGTDLVELARQNRLPRLIGREDELETVMGILSKKSKNAVVLIGEAGVGKSAIVEGLAQLVADGNVPHALSHVRIMSINMALLAAGASMVGELEGRVQSIVKKAREDRDIILFMDELHTICSQNSDVSQMLKADLARGAIRVIGATTFKEYRQIEQDAALARRFQKVIVKEPSTERTLDILRKIRPDYEDHHNVTIPDETLAEIVRLSVRYVKDRFLPDKAIDLMDEAASRLSLMSIKDPGDEPQKQNLKNRIRQAIASGNYGEASRLCSQKEDPKEVRA